MARLRATIGEGRGGRAGRRGRGPATSRCRACRGPRCGWRGSRRGSGTTTPAPRSDTTESRLGSSRGRQVSTADHHSAYIGRAVAALTPQGLRRADELLEQLAQAAGGREWLVRFAKAREAEAEGVAIADEPAHMLG